MLTTTASDNSNEILIRADSDTLDRITHLIYRITGNYRIPPVRLLPDQANATSLLLGLTYLIGQARNGICELYTQPNGVNSEWIAPKGTADEFITRRNPEWKLEPVIDEIENAIITSRYINLESFYEMEEDEQSAALKAIGIKAEKISSFFETLKRRRMYCYSAEDYPDVTFSNTYFQIRLNGPEAALYAYVLCEVMRRKELLLQNMAAEAETQPEDIKKEDLEYCLMYARSNLALLDHLKELLFSGLAQISKPADRAELLKKESPEGFATNWGGSTLQEVANLLREYGTDNPADTLRFIDELLKL